MNTQESLGERIKIARKGVFSNQEELAKAIGCHKNTISRYEGNKRIPDATDIQRLCDALHITPKWLLMGEGEMQSQDALEKPDEQLPPTPEIFPIIYEAQGTEELVNIPLVSARLSAGVGSLQVDDEIERFFAFSRDFLRRKGNPARMVVMKVEGDSMEPEIKDGDMVLVDQSKTEIRLGRIFAVGFGEAIYLKRIDALPGKLLLKSVNPNYAPVEILLSSQEADSFRVIGQVLWVGREY